MAAGKGSSNHLSDEELRKGLLDLGFSPGPVTSTTREVLVRKMKKLSLPGNHGDHILSDFFYQSAFVLPVFYYCVQMTGVGEQLSMNPPPALAMGMTNGQKGMFL